MQQFNNRYLIYKSIIVLGLAVVFNLFSCKKLVEIPPPSDKLVTETVFSTSATANQAAIGIYNSMSGNGESYRMSQSCGLLADELKNYSTSISQAALYHNAMTSSMAPGCWVSGYKFIYQANAILNGVQNNTSIPQIVIRRLIGEAKFIRAFWYFYLTLSYGDVPIATGIDYRVNTQLGRSSQSEVYKLIISDLKEAKGLLPDDFMDATDTTMTTERLRPTSWAARALLARVYLFNKKYDSATIETNAVIDHTALFNLNNDLNEVFLANSKEAIWQNAYRLPNTTNTTDGLNFILTAAPRNVALSSILVNSFESGDSRLINWTNHIGASVVYYYPFKYKIRNGSDPTVHTEHAMVLRLAEQYLIRAEARVQQNDISGAVDDLNIIRHRAGLGDYLGPADNKDSVLSALLHERQVELFTEWGHRWFDLIRTGNINSVMSVIAPQKGGTWDASGYQQLFPIPQRERGINPGITQNTGYF